jgi:hypothetical protein
VIELTRAEFLTIWTLVCGSLALVVVMFAYTVRVARRAQLGDRWIDAAGTPARALQALRDFSHETDALLVAHGSRFPPGYLITYNRLDIERLIRQADRGGGPGL